MPVRYRALADALAAGIPPRRAFDLVRLEGESTGSAASAALARGESLTQAIELLTSPPHHHVVALRAAEHAGRMPETLRSLADDLDAQAAARSAFVARAAYPVLILHLVVPATSTGLLIDHPGSFVVRTLGSYALLWTFLLGLAWLVRYLVRHPIWVRRVVRWPLVGPPVRIAAQLRFLRALASLYGAGIRIDEALSEASAAVGPAPPTPEFSKAAAIARAGETIERALAVLLSLDPLARMELITAAQAGSLEDALERVVLRLQEAWEASLQRSARITAGILYVTAVVVAGAAIVSFYAGYLAQFSPPKR